MFTRCSVCDYFKMLIEQCPREEHDIREFMKDRLGCHFDFQAARRLAHGRVEEEAAQSAGEHCLSLIDKMDQRQNSGAIRMEPITHTHVQRTGPALGDGSHLFHVVRPKSDVTSYPYGMR